MGYYCRPSNYRRKPVKGSISRLKTLLRSDADLMVAFKHRKTNTFITDVLRKSMKFELSSNQISALKNAGRGAVKFAAKQAAAAELLKDAPIISEGKYEFAGTVVTIKLHESRFGYIQKMIVESPSGNKLWGTLPTKYVESIEVGSKIKLTATVKRAPDSDHFGFFSRPSKVEIIN